MELAEDSLLEEKQSATDQLEEEDSLVEEALSNED